MDKQTRKLVCVVAGVGPRNGADFARRFAAEGYPLALLSRHSEFTQELAEKLDDARAYVCDVSDAAEVANIFETIRAGLGEVDVLVYNPGIGVWANVAENTPEAFESSWRTNVLGALLTAKQVIPAMKKIAAALSSSAPPHRAIAMQHAGLGCLMVPKSMQTSWNKILSQHIKELLRQK